MDINLAQLEALSSFEMHDIALKFITSRAQTRVIIKGNQGGGTAACMYDLALRILGIHPVAKRNIINAPMRCVSKCLPKNDEDEENQQYVEFKRMIPTELKRKDITFRTNSMEFNLKQADGKKAKKVEFMSKKQDIDAFMAVQRQALYQDEEIEKMKYDENQMRLLRWGGDTVVTLTPVRGLDWTYDHLWRRARVIYRSKVICDKFGYSPVEETGNDTDIEVFCWATDDNPALTPDSINRLFDDIDDDDDLAMRRYGVFKQVSGRIYKAFDKTIHVINPDILWKNNYRNSFTATGTFG